MTINFSETFDIPAPRNLQEQSGHKIPKGFFGTHLALLRSSSLVLCSAMTCPRSMEKLPKDLAIEMASHVTADTADPMEYLGSLRATYS
jgi:hypothetical protein